MPDIKLSAVQKDFLRRFPKKTFSKGETIICQGEKIEHVYFLAKGDCSRKVFTDSGEEVVYDRRTASNSSNDFIAAIYSYMLGKESTFTYSTDNGCEVNVIPQDKFLAFLTDNPEVMHGLLFRICNRYNDLNQNFLSKRSNNTTALICAILNKSVKTVNGVHIVDKKSLSVTELAKRVGSHRVTVSKIIARLCQEEIIRKEPGGIIIEDMDSLNEYASGIDSVKFNL